MPVVSRRGFDLDVAIHLAATRESESLRVPDPPEEQQRSGENAETFPQARPADVVLALRDQNVATATNTETQAVERKSFVEAPIDLDSIFQRRRAEIGAGGNFDGLLLFDESDFGHDASGFEIFEDCERGGMIRVAVASGKRADARSIVERTSRGEAVAGIATASRSASRGHADREHSGERGQSTG